MIVLFHDISDFIEEFWQRPPLADTPVRFCLRTVAAPHRWPMLTATFVATFIQTEERVVRLELPCGDAPRRDPDRFLSDDGERDWIGVNRFRAGYEELIRSRCQRETTVFAGGMYVPRGGGYDGT